MSSECQSQVETCFTPGAKPCISSAAVACRPDAHLTKVPAAPIGWQNHRQLVMQLFHHSQRHLTAAAAVQTVYPGGGQKCVLPRLLLPTQRPCGRCCVLHAVMQTGRHSCWLQPWQHLPTVAAAASAAAALAATATEAAQAHQLRRSGSGWQARQPFGMQWRWTAGAAVQPAQVEQLRRR